MEKTGFIYIWRDKKRNMYYIGCHWGTEDDGYICSSKWMRDAYRYRSKDFKRRILKTNIARSDLLKEEYEWLRLIKKECLGTKYYNINNTHFGHWSNMPNSNLSVREKLSRRTKELHQDPVYREKYLEGRKKLPKTQTKETIEKRVKANTGKKRTDETKRKMSISQKGKIRGPLSEEHRQKVSESLKGNKNPFYGKQHDPDRKKEMSAKASSTMKGRPPNNAEWTKTTFWWNNGSINKRSPKSPGESWNKGRKI